MKTLSSVYIAMMSFAVIFVMALQTPAQEALHVDSSFSSDDAPTDPVAQLIYRTITLSRQSPGGEPLYTPEMLQRMYEVKHYQPVWITDDGQGPSAEGLIMFIEEVSADGLVPEHYHLMMIKDLLTRIRQARLTGEASDPAIIAETDLLLSDAFFMLGCHLAVGCVDPLTIEAQWFVTRDGINVYDVLEEALLRNRVQEVLTSLLPSHPGYEDLKMALLEHRFMASRGEWPKVSTGGLLRKGDSSSRVAEVRRRLAASGDFTLQNDAVSDIFDEELHHAVQQFQLRHGLRVDGVVGPLTTGMMNVVLHDRIRQLEVNLERLRWIPRSFGERYITVNIADYHLTVVEEGEEVISMKVVVGKPFWHTPVFHKKLSYLVINPSWNVPESIAKEEIIPKIKADSEYLKREGMMVVQGWGAGQRVIDASSIPWHLVEPETFPYRFVQRPGPRNPLGRIKFMLPNKFNIYLHDTPSKGLFARDTRAFSHGCIRLEKPFVLARYLLKNDEEWSDLRIAEVLDSGQEMEVGLPEPIKVYVVYLTAWVDGNKDVHFRDDVYGRDQILYNALKQKPRGDAEDVQAVLEESATEGLERP